MIVLVGLLLTALRYRSLVLVLEVFFIDWLDRVLYRNRAWRRRFNGCAICARYCPAQRLETIDGFPRARGTCTLCLGCVNLCPRNAMHLLCWTEYGQPYEPRWPELVVKSKEELAAFSKNLDNRIPTELHTKPGGCER
jgi:NAD-dependent dihydropyrimidine dehydrogenase PreA subunit